MEEYSRNWASIAAYAIAGIEMALLDIKGKALGVPVAELLGGLSRTSIPVIGYLFIDEPEANAAKAAEFVAAGHTELKLKVGRSLSQDFDTIAAIRDRVGPDVKLRIDANMNWSVPAAIKWIRALEQFDLQFVEQPVPDFDLAGMAQVRRAVSTPIAADESCTSVRSALALIEAEACDVFVVYPSEAGGLTRANQIGAIAAAAGKWCVIGSWAELGVATTANAHLAAASSNFPFANDTHYPLQLERRPRRAGRDRERPDRRLAASRARRLARPGGGRDAVRARAPRVPVLRRHPRRGPERRADPLTNPAMCGLSSQYEHVPANQ